MAIVTDQSIACCNTVIKALNEVVSHEPTYRIQNPGAFFALTEERNRQGLDLVPVKMEGKNIAFRARYWTNPRDNGDGGDGWPSLCVPGDTTGQKGASFTANIVKNVKLTLSETQFRDFCGIPEDGNVENISLTQFGRDQSRAKLNELLSKYNEGLLTELISRIGKFTDSSSAKDIDLISSDNKSALLPGFYAIKDEFQKAELPQDDIMVIGAGNFDRAMAYENYACCSDAGTNIAGINSAYTYYRDYKVGSLTGNVDAFLAMTPGSAVPFFDPWFTNAYIHNGSTNIIKQNIPVTMNVNGVLRTINVDFTAKYDECGSTDSELSPENRPDSKWILTWTLAGGLATIPDDIELSDSPFYQVNNIFRFNANKAS